MLSRIICPGIVLYALASNIAMAQTNPCSSIPDNTDRLTCYDKQAKSIKSPGAKPATDPIIAVAKAAIGRQLKDPASARYEDIRIKPNAVCGWVNSKNAMGGYAGRKLFVYVVSEHVGYVLDRVDDPAYGQAAIAAMEKYCQAEN